MARERVLRITSDLSGKVVEDESQAAELRVLSHPLIDSPVKFDAFQLELQSLLDKNQELVSLEVVLPGEEPIQVLVKLADFDKLVTAGSADEALANAEPYYPRPQIDDAPPRRRGRPRKDGSAPAAVPAKEKRDPAFLLQLREWARQNGWPDLGNRGRIPAAAEAAWNEAHKGA